MPKKSPWTPAAIEEMEKRFRDGATTLEAIEGIMAESTYYDYLKEHEDMAVRMQLARDYVTEIARGVVARAIKRGDRDSAKWWLERKKKDEFSTKVEQDVRVKELPKPILGGTSQVDVPGDDSN